MTPLNRDRVKANGEVFTPPWLVSDVLNLLPPEMFVDPTKTFLDPSCGDGAFLVEVVQRKLERGATPQLALSTTYGVELMADNVEVCRRRLLEVVRAAGHVVTAEMRVTVEHNIVCADALTGWDFARRRALSRRRIAETRRGYDPH